MIRWALMLITGWLLMAAPALAQAGVFIRPGTSSITSPVAYQTYVYDSNFGRLNVWNGSAWNTITAAYNLAGVGAPTVSNDNTQGYQINSIWYDTVGGQTYICQSSATGAAVWSQITGFITPATNATQLTTSDIFSDFVVSGLLGTAPSNSLSMTTPSGVAYVSGTRASFSSTSYTYTASQDTYDYLQSNGTVNHPSVNNGNPAPTGQTGLYIQKVVTNASKITTVTQSPNSAPLATIQAAASSNQAITLGQGNSLYAPLSPTYLVESIAAGVPNATILQAGSGITLTPSSGLLTISTSVAAISNATNVGPTGITWSNSVASNAVTNTGTWSNQNANTAFRGPSSGSANTPAFRQDVLADLPLAYTHPEQCRITLTSGTPVTTSDVTGASTFYVDPYKGNVVSLPDSTGNNFTSISFSEISTSVPSAIFRLYDVFLSNNSGSAAVTTTAWDSGGQTTGTITGATAANPCVLTSSNSLSVGQYIGIAGITGTLGTTAANGLNGKVFRVASANSTTITLEAGVNTTGLTYTSGGTWYLIPTSRTTTLTEQNGLYLQTGNLNRVYIGTIMAGEQGVSGQTNDAVASRLVYNYFNRVNRGLTANDTTSSWTYTTATFRPRDNNMAAGVGRVEAVTGIVEEPWTGATTVACQNTSTGVEGINEISINSVAAAVSTFPGQAGFVSALASGLGICSVYGYLSPPLGYSFAQVIEESSAATGTETFSGSYPTVITTRQ